MFLICTVSETAMSPIFNVSKILINMHSVLCTANSKFTGQMLISLNYQIKSNIY
jgi:hypothetical protein